MKLLVQWCFNMMISLAEHSESLTQEEEKKLNIVFDVIDLLIQQQCLPND